MLSLSPVTDKYKMKNVIVVFDETAIWVRLLYCATAKCSLKTDDGNILRKNTVHKHNFTITVFCARPQISVGRWQSSCILLNFISDHKTTAMCREQAKVKIWWPCAKLGLDFYWTLSAFQSGCGWPSLISKFWWCIIFRVRIRWLVPNSARIRLAFCKLFVNYISYLSFADFSGASAATLGFQKSHFISLNHLLVVRALFRLKLGYGWMCSSR